MVNHPPHYNTGEVETIEGIRAALGKEGFIAHCRGTAIKYLWRAGFKSEDTYLQDLEKAQWYLSKAIDELKNG